MTEREVGFIGETLLGRPGVLLMVTFWSIGVGCAALPLRFGRPIRFSIPGFGVALLLALLPPTLIGVFACTMAASLAVMVPALWLIGTDERRNRRLAATLLLASGLLLGIGPLLPESYVWLAFPLTPVLIFGIPVGILLLTHRALLKWPWLSATAASVAFSLAWLVWMARDYYYRLKY